MFIIVERTKARVVLARVAQFDTSLGDEVYDVNLGFDFVNGGHAEIIDLIDGNGKSNQLNKNGAVHELPRCFGGNVNRRD